MLIQNQAFAQSRFQNSEISKKQTSKAVNQNKSTASLIQPSSLNYRALANINFKGESVDFDRLLASQRLGDTEKDTIKKYKDNENFQTLMKGRIVEESGLILQGIARREKEILASKKRIFEKIKYSTDESWLDKQELVPSRVEDGKTLPPIKAIDFVLEQIGYTREDMKSKEIFEKIPLVKKAFISHDHHDSVGKVNELLFADRLTSEYKTKYLKADMNKEFASMFQLDSQNRLIQQELIFKINSLERRNQVLSKQMNEIEGTEFGNDCY